jgi:hypothetical protein
MISHSCKIQVSAVAPYPFSLPATVNDSLPVCIFGSRISQNGQITARRARETRVDPLPDRERRLSGKQSTRLLAFGSNAGHSLDGEFLAPQQVERHVLPLG